MPSRQFEHQQEATLRRLQAMIPHECPLWVRRIAPGTTLGGGFAVYVLDHDEGCSGRFQVVAAWIDGYLAAWKAER
jgi:hypothetical protein